MDGDLPGELNVSVGMDSLLAATDCAVGHGGGKGDIETEVTEAVCARYDRSGWKDGIVRTFCALVRLLDARTHEATYDVAIV
jgi:hypothetical protein